MTKKTLNFARKGHGDMRGRLFSLATTSLIALSMLAACSDSFLFGGNGSPPPDAVGVPPPVPGAPMTTPFGGGNSQGGSGIQGQGGQQGQGQQSGQSGQSQTQAYDSRFEIDSTNENAIEALFPGQDADPFEINRAGSSAKMKLEMVSVEKDETKHENYVKIRVTITLKLRDGSTLSRAYQSEEGKNVVLSNSGTKDIMTGELKATDHSDDTVKINATREAVADTGNAQSAERRAQANPWAGKLSTSDGKSLGSLRAVHQAFED